MHGWPVRTGGKECREKSAYLIRSFFKLRMASYRAVERGVHVLLAAELPCANG